MSSWGARSSSHRGTCTGLTEPIDRRLACRDEDKPREDERMEDGYTIKYLPAELLRDLNIVDTPGTNVILERQQRLTEEYVPRADMVLFTMSAGEVRILGLRAIAL